MIVNFLNRLAFVLQSRIQGTSNARVEVAPGPNNPGNRPVVLISTEYLEPAASRLGNRPEMVVPGDSNPRRVVRANWSTRLRVIPTNSGGTGEARDVLDTCLYALDAPDFRNGQALTNGAPDPGFLVDALLISSMESPFDGVDGNDPNTDIIIQSEGVLWPAGEAGVAGPQIVDVFLRGVLLPIALGPIRLVANGGATDLSLNVRPFLQMQDGATSGTFTSLALQVLDESGNVRNNALQGQVDGLLIVPVTGEQLTVTYTPPATPTTESLLIYMDDNEDNAGLELARFTLTIHAAG